MLFRSAMMGIYKMFEHSKDLVTTSCLVSTVGHEEVLQDTLTTVPFEHSADTWEVASDDAGVPACFSAELQATLATVTHRPRLMMQALPLTSGGLLRLAM